MPSEGFPSKTELMKELSSAGAYHPEDSELAQAAQINTAGLRGRGPRAVGWEQGMEEVRPVRPCTQKG